MSRPPCCRRVVGSPAATLFRPNRDEADCGEAVVLALDEFEAIRLADREGMTQEKAARAMQVSRPTFGRILESGHRKVAQSLTEGRSLRIEGGAACTVRGHGPQSCPRWNRDVAPPDACVAPCGRRIAGRRGPSATQQTGG